MAKRKHGRVATARIGRTRSQTTLLDLLRVDKTRVLKVLEKHGVHLDASTYITLTASLEKAAAYHAVADRKRFVRELLGK